MLWDYPKNPTASIRLAFALGMSTTPDPIPMTRSLSQCWLRSGRRTVHTAFSAHADAQRDQ